MPAPRSVVTVPDCTPQTLDIVLQWMYGCEVALEWRSIVSVYKFAGRRSLAGLQRRCVDGVAQLSVEHTVGLYALAGRAKSIRLACVRRLAGAGREGAAAVARNAGLKPWAGDGRIDAEAWLASLKASAS